MTRKHYRAVANGFKAALFYATSAAERDGVASAARQVAEELKADNGHFRYDKFYEWIGLDGWGQVVRSEGVHA